MAGVGVEVINLGGRGVSQFKVIHFGTGQTILQEGLTESLQAATPVVEVVALLKPEVPTVTLMEVMVEQLILQGRCYFMVEEEQVAACQQVQVMVVVVGQGYGGQRVNLEVHKQVEEAVGRTVLWDAVVEGALQVWLFCTL
jgi:hypothetical protein